MHDFELYGYSVFETIPARKGSFWRLDQHWSRLSSAAQHFALTPPSRQTFIDALVQCHDADRHEVMRYALVMEGGRWSVAKPGTAVRLMKKSAGKPRQALRLMTFPEGLACGDRSRCFKTGARMELQRAYMQARDQGYDDCLLIDQQGYILECTTGNLFLRIGGQWITPTADRGLLAGISRNWLLELGLAKEETVHREQLAAAEAVIYTNAVEGLVPVIQLDKRDFCGEHVAHLLGTFPQRQFQPQP